MKKIFVLESFEPVEGSRKGTFERAGDGVSVKLRSGACGVFSSVGKAEKAIAAMVKAKESEIASWGGPRYFGFALIEHRLDDPFLPDSATPCRFRSYRTYLGDGTLNCFSDTDDACEKKFKGAKRASRFRKGDFAWTLRRGKAVPALVECEAYTVEEWKAKMRPGAYGDCTDDSGIDFPYFPYGNCGHDHTFAPLLFPLKALPCGIPRAAMAKMKSARRRYLYGKE